MTSTSHTYTDASSDIQTADSRTRFGSSPRRPMATTRYEREENSTMTTHYGSHMPLDSTAHWDGRNPLNILPAMCLLLLVVGLVALVLA